LVSQCNLDSYFIALKPDIFSDGKMFYGIFGDTDGDTPETIGEASWLMARTCFPNEDLNGNNGHDPADVTCKKFLVCPNLF